MRMLISRAVVLTMLMASSLMIWWNNSSSEPVVQATTSVTKADVASVEQPAALETETVPASASTPATEPSRPAPNTIPIEKLNGRWEDAFYGKRMLEFRDDGVGLMRIDLDFAGQLLYGPFLEFDFRWTWNDEMLAMEMSGGRPVDAAKSVAKSWGEKFAYRIISLSESTLELRTVDSPTLYKLTRVSSPTSGPDR